MGGIHCKAFWDFIRFFVFLLLYPHTPFCLCDEPLVFHFAYTSECRLAARIVIYHRVLAFVDGWKVDYLYLLLIPWKGRKEGKERDEMHDEN